MKQSRLAILYAIIRRDIRLAWSQGGAGPLAVGFFIIAVSLFPLGIGPEPGLLTRISPGILWITALLAGLLSLDRMYQADFEDGTLDDLALCPVGLYGVCSAKIVAHWTAAMVPVILLAPALALFVNVPGESLPWLIASFLIGTPALSLLGSVGAALTVAVRRGGILIALLILPLYVPVLIFAAGTLDASLNLVDPTPNLALTAAASLIAGLICPFASAAALRLALE